jgi:hypothetical protein
MSSVAFLISLGIASFSAFISFARADTSRFSAAFTTFTLFPFWVICIVFAICHLVHTLRTSYLFRLARTLHINHSYRPPRPVIDTAPPPVVTERDITSATPTSANYFRHV